LSLPGPGLAVDCQPLHASYLSQGDPAQVVKKPRSDGYKLAADGVHSGYEDDMIAYGYQQQGLAAKLATKVTSFHETAPRITSGYEASQAIVALIRATQDEIAPSAIVDEWTALKGSSGRNEQMWAAFGTDTITCMARGTRYLAAIWQAAWDLGGDDTEIGNGGLVPQADLMKLYLDPDVVPSIPLDHFPDNPAEGWSELKRPEKAA